MWGGETDSDGEREREMCQCFAFYIDIYGLKDVRNLCARLSVCESVCVS